ncbi:MAG TPA: RDD family protein [Acidimicrobiales bacterium]|nr:RDD family protein [Acidimicrobiales bacterium]
MAPPGARGWGGNGWGSNGWGSNVFHDPRAALIASLPTGPEANIRQRIGARAIDLVLEGTATIIVAVNGPAGRPLLSGVIAFALVFAYETICVAAGGATLGKRLVGLEVVPVGRTGPITWSAAARRGAAVASVALGFFAGAGPGILLGVYLLVSTSSSLHYRGGHDRAARTYVVEAKRRPRIVTQDDLDQWIDLRHARTWIDLGLLATFAERRRARAQRLEHAPFLLAYLVGSALLFVTIWQTLAAFVWLTLAWIVVFTVDETIRVHRSGTTSGHTALGLVIVDRRTGRPPGWWRSTLRAFVLGLGMFTPFLPVLALWTKVADEQRGPHDLAGRTVVVAHPALSDRVSRLPVPPTAPVERF